MLFSGVQKGADLMTLYLARFEIEAERDLQLEPEERWFGLSTGLCLIESHRSQSKLYHAIKWQLPDHTPLIVAALAERPKFKGMAAGALKWVREL